MLSDVDQQVATEGAEAIDSNINNVPTVVYLIRSWNETAGKRSMVGAKATSSTSAPWSRIEGCTHCLSTGGQSPERQSVGACRASKGKQSAGGETRAGEAGQTHRGAEASTASDADSRRPRRGFLNESLDLPSHRQDHYAAFRRSLSRRLPAATAEFIGLLPAEAGVHGQRTG